MDIVDDDKGEEFMRNNSHGVGKLMPFGLTCQVGGKEVPCYVTCSPHGGITGEMLAGLLKYLDELDIFPREEGPDPFIVLEGHNSRLSLPFLEYIMDPKHKWTVCVGIPYATDLWQFGDAPEVNGSFKQRLTKAKEEVTSHNRATHRPVAFSQTDVIPLLNAAWFPSFDW